MSAGSNAAWRGLAHHHVREPTYRIDIRFHADRLLVSIGGAPGPDGERHLAEVQAAAAKCGLEVVVLAKRATRPTSLRPRKRVR